MSQSKVDQRKYEKKHRKEILRKQKVKKVLAVTITIVVIAGIVGSIAGVKIYKAIPKYVEASSLNSYIDKAYSDLGFIAPCYWHRCIRGRYDGLRGGC